MDSKWTDLDIFARAFVQSIPMDDSCWMMYGIKVILWIRFEDNLCGSNFFYRCKKGDGVVIKANIYPYSSETSIA